MILTWVNIFIWSFEIDGEDERTLFILIRVGCDESRPFFVAHGYFVLFFISEAGASADFSHYALLSTPTSGILMVHRLAKNSCQVIFPSGRRTEGALERRG